MKKSFSNIFGLFTLVMTLFLSMSIQSAYASPSFPGGATQSMGSLCNNSGAVNIGSYLRVDDPTAGSTIVWSISGAPAHGTLSGFSTALTSTGATLTPSGLTFTPTAGYSGTDAFTIQVTDGTTTVFTTINVTINPTPIVGAISGTSTHCVGTSTTFTDTTVGGAWVSLNTSIATINASTGVAFGVSVGSATIIYTVTNAFSCTGVASIIDNIITVPTVDTIAGPTNICISTPTTYTDATAGGVWTSSNAAVATVNSSGLLTPVSAGTVNLTYTVTNACGATNQVKTITINPSSLSAIVPGSAVNVCITSSTTLSHPTSGGTWSSSDASIATIDPTSGLLTGVATGSATITYSVTNACGTLTRTKNITVSGLPPTSAPIAGLNSICAGATSTYTDDSTGGTWSISPLSIATITAGGLVTGVSVGTATITYTRTNSCGSAFVTKSIVVTTVPATPSAISGSSPICVGSSTTLSTSTTGGTWSSSNAAIASITSTGDVTGVSTGTVNISYTVSNSCGASAAVFSFTVIDVPAMPAAITGTFTLCAGNSTTLNDATVGGTWSSTNTGVATISATGTVTAVSAGTTTISYSFSNFCGTTAATQTFVVNTVPAVPASITGASSVCVGLTTTLSSATSGGVWSSSATGIATINSATGLARGVAVGSANITYTVSNACGVNRTSTALSVITVITPAGIGGTAAMCVGATTTLTNSVSGGTWSSSNTAVATVDTTTGVVTGVSGTATATITYSITNTCGTRFVTRNVTVTAPPSAPAAIAGTTIICIGGNTTLTDATAGGVWSSANTSIATINATGLVTGVSAGVGTISYTRSNACGAVAAVTTVTVNAPPTVPAITGTSPVCVGSTTTYSNALSGGNWTTGNAAIATVGATTGIVTGVSTGSTNIFYTVSNSCGSSSVLLGITVNDVPALPSAITGASTVCVGDTIELNSLTAGGTWSSTNTSTATVDATGVVTGVATGSTIISYTVTNACGNRARTSTIVINDIPAIAAISGSTTVCVGGTTALTNTTVGGTWSSVTTANATITGAGVVTGVAVGTSVISYTLTNACGTNAATLTMNVSTLPGVPAAITGTPTSICIGANTTYASATAGGVWTSSNTSIATIDASSGVITGVGVGSANITYTVSNACGSRRQVRAVTITTVPAAPAAITGTASVCVSGTTTLSSTTPGGSWSSSDNSLATVSGTGVVTGLITGTVTISYTVSNACGSTSITRAVNIITVPNAPAAIAGPDSVCVAAAITLTDATPSGSWSSVTTSVATVTSGGVVTGVAGGSTLISYTVSNVCGSTAVTKTIYVNTTPTAPAAITGLFNVCVGDSTTLADATAGGVWSSSNPTIATVNSTTGMVNTLVVGTTTISYSVSNGCGPTAATVAFNVITVPAAPAAIGGSATACVGATSTLSNATTGGTWSSGNTAIATVDATTGVVTGVSGGTVSISYTVTNACGSTSTSRSFIVTTPPAPPAAITGATSVCAGSNTTLSSATTGGTWSSSDNSIATVNATTGVVRGVAAGTVNISYTVTNSCGPTSITATVNVVNAAVVAPITGPTRLCTSGTITLACDTPGGSWLSTNTAIANVSSSGVVTGVAPGVVTILYIVTNACGPTIVSHVDTVISGTLPAITGTTTVCIASTTTLSNATTGGRWTSQNISVATIDSVTGVATGVSAGAVTISYSVNNACGTLVTTTTLNVQSNVIASIGGTTTFCEGFTSTLTNDTLGGTWSSSNTAIATVTTTGVVTGVAPGTATISYTITNSCGTNFRTTTVTIDPLPVPGTITGLTSVCPSATITLSSTTSGGTWTSSNTGIATVDASSGVVTGVNSGPVTITYTVSNPCGTRFGTYNMTVNPLPITAPITGTDSVCVGSAASLFDATTGGSWSSSNTSVATVSPTGVVTGVSVGTATISYTLFNICGRSDSTRLFTVNPVPSVGAIAGTFTVCATTTTTLTDTATGGVWTSSNTSVGTINSTTGVFTGVAAGTTNITYTLTNIHGCTATAVQAVTVSPLPVSGTISGTPNVCAGNNRTLTASVGGGTWSSSNTSIASVNASGVVNGVGVGVCTIYYSVTNSCGTARDSVVFTVNPLANPGTIAGPDSVCAGSTITLTNTISGHVWSSANTAIATVNTSGVVTGVSGGSVVISYTATNSCNTAAATKTVFVNTLPTAGSITGTTTFCEGATSTLTATTTGGTWSSNNTAVATVNTTGVVTGVSGGTARISYSITNTCGTTVISTIVTINPLPTTPTLTGLDTICTSATTTITPSVGAGIFASSNVAVATVNAAGLVTGVTAGTVTISYTITNACGSRTATKNMVINASPVAGPILGTGTVCPGDSITLTNSTAGGTWSSSNTALATVNSTTGVVRGISTGLVNITYTVTNSCGTNFQLRTISVNTLPNAGTITGVDTLCLSATSLYTCTSTAGAWSSQNAAIVNINAITGSANATGLGTTNIRYIVSNICGTDTAFKSVTVITTPTVAPISGPSAVCVSDSISLTSTTTGGTWTSSNVTLATVGATTGRVRGIATGTVNITYTVTNSCGTGRAIQAVTVNPLPNPGTITGVSPICQTSTYSFTITGGTAGGSWSSSNSTIATVHPTTGSVTGVNPGPATITYTVTNSCGSAFTTRSFNVTPLPIVGPIIGAGPLCQYASITLTDSSTTGTWSATGAVSVTAGGVVTGVTPGTGRVYFTKTNVCGSRSDSVTITVSPAPNAGTIVGADTICISATSTYTNTTSVGTRTWSSNNTSVATVSATGVVTAVSVGTARIVYTVTNSCGTDSTFKDIHVMPAPAIGTITGTNTLCQFTTTTLSMTTTGVTWSSSNTAVATVTSTGVVTGATAGTSIITCSFTNFCGTVRDTMMVRVFPAPDAGVLSGIDSVCQGTNRVFTSTVSGGTWSSANTSIASIVSTTATTATIAGVATGATSIIYQVTNSCGNDTVMRTLRVIPQPVLGTISGGGAICIGATTTLTSTSSVGAWSISPLAVATITPGGIVTGVSSGTAIASYTVTNSCGTVRDTQTVIVAPVPNATITGVNRMCVGSTTLLSGAMLGGTWTSSDSTIASVASGTVSGLRVGTTIITYSVTTLCGTNIDTQSITVNPLPFADTIRSTRWTICQGGCVTLTSAAIGGVWSTSTSTIATLSSTGTLCGVSGGLSIVSYTVTNFCGSAFDTAQIVVIDTPRAGVLSGPPTVCEGFTINISTSGMAGGTWTISDTTRATISTSGVVTGIAAGTATVTYTMTNACGTSVSTRSVTVNPLPISGTITGSTFTVCVGSRIDLDSTRAGGTWSVTPTTIATASAGGYIYGVSAGTATVTYTVTNGCGTAFTTATVAVNPLPDAGTVSGMDSVCTGDTISLASTTTGGGWSSSNVAIATVNSAGLVYGVSSGLVTISYIVVNSCGTAYARHTVFVNPIAIAGTITGPTSVCEGSTITLSNPTGTIGGIWSSSSTAIATISSTGVVTGVDSGFVTITYTARVSTCASAVATYRIRVNPAPDAGTISGPAAVCYSSIVTYTTTGFAGAWSSSNTAVATITSAGVLSAIIPGTTVVSYITSNACGSDTATYNVTVDNDPTAGVITGTSTLCIGTTTTLRDTITGGVWSSASTAIATVTTGGVVTGAAAGTAIISYTVTNTCGVAGATRLVTVLPAPTSGTITGPSNVCRYSAVAFSTTGTGGTWTTSNAAIATATSSGAITGVNVGNVIISYTVSNICGSSTDTMMVTIDPHTRPEPISGSNSLCLGTPTTLTNPIPGGTWSVTNANARISATGVVTPLLLGVDTVYYTISDACGVELSVFFVNINTYPDAGSITGRNYVCDGDSVRLSNATPGGYWSSNAISVATVSTTGWVVGVSPGDVVIAYNVFNFCGTATDTIAMNVRRADRCDVSDVKDVASITEVSIFPNPATATLHITAPADVNIAIISPDGKMLIQQHHAKDVDISRLADGLYMIMIYDDNRNLIKSSRFIKAE